MLRADRLWQSVWLAVTVSSACACVRVSLGYTSHFWPHFWPDLQKATAVSTARGMGQKDHGGLSLHVLGLGGWDCWVMQSTRESVIPNVL